MPLSYHWKWVGVILVAVALALTIVFMKFDFQLNLPVFAISAYFMEHKLFKTFPTNVSDEIIMALYLIGFALIVFSREKVETQELNILKYKSFIKAAFINTIFLIFSILFIYGGSFIAVLVANFISQFIIYLFIFYIIEKNKTLDC